MVRVEPWSPGEDGQLIRPSYYRHLTDTPETAVSVSLVIINRTTQSVSVSTSNTSVTSNITFTDTSSKLPIVKCQFHFQEWIH